MAPKARVTCLRCGHTEVTTLPNSEPTSDTLQEWAIPLADAHEVAGCGALDAPSVQLESLLADAIRPLLKERTDAFFSVVARLAKSPTAQTEVVVATSDQSSVVLDAAHAGVASVHVMGAHPSLAAHDALLSAELGARIPVTACVSDASDVAVGARRWFVFLPNRTLAMESRAVGDEILLKGGTAPAPDDEPANYPINHLRLASATVLAAP